MVTKYLFVVNEQGHIIAGTILRYDDADPAPDYPEEYTQEGSEEVWNSQHLYFFNDASGQFELIPNYTPPDPVPEPISMQEQLQMVEAENANLKGRLADVELALADLFTGL